MEHVLNVLPHHSQKIAKTSINSCQNTPEWSSRWYLGEVASILLSKFPERKIITWHEMWQSLQPHHCIVWQWRVHHIRKTCKTWKLTLSSSMASYSVMHDIHDARRVPMERGWVALYATYKYSNQLTLEQWAFEHGCFGTGMLTPRRVKCSFGEKANLLHVLLFSGMLFLPMYVMLSL